MAAGTRQTNTQEEMLRKLLPLITEMKLSEDADPDFITELETRLIGKIREPIDRARAMQMTAADPALAAGGDPMAMGAIDPTGGAMAGGGGIPTEAGGLPPEMLLQLMAAAGGPPPTPAVNQRGLAPSPDMTGGIDELRRILSQ